MRERAARFARLRQRYRDSATTERRPVDEPIIDLREGREGRVLYHGVTPPSTYGYDSVLPVAWRTERTATRGTIRRESPSVATRPPLPRRFRLLRRFPPLQSVVHHGPVDGEDVDVKLTVQRSIRLHTTGIEHPLRDLDGRLREDQHLRLLIDAFGLDRRSFGTQVQHAPSSLEGAKRLWHKSIAARARHGFALAGNYLVVLEYLPPDRDIRRRDFGIAYKRIVMAYEIDVTKV